MAHMDGPGIRSRLGGGGFSVPFIMLFAVFGFQGFRLSCSHSDSNQHKPPAGS